jgi:hypothetical protein
MKSSIEYKTDENYILVTISGTIDVFSMRNVIEDAGKVILEHNCNKIIGDFRKAILPISVLEIIDLYKYWINSLQTNQIVPFEAKRVILMDQGQKTAQNFEFFETISINRNSRVKIFFDMDKAVEWITG